MSKHGLSLCNLSYPPQKLIPGLTSRHFLTSANPSKWHVRHQATAYRTERPPQFVVPQMTVSSPTIATQPTHAHSVSQTLSNVGILKITLAFPDPSSAYLTSLLHTLHSHHAHALPISHSATRGWFWDVRPTTTNLQTANHQARSETAEDFPWHTDCSYEELVPRYFALQVLQHDRFGGGTLSVLNVQKLMRLLGKDTREALMQPEYRIRIPREFLKDERKSGIVGSILKCEEQEAGVQMAIRYREDLITPLSQRAEEAINELSRVLRSQTEIEEATLRLTAMDLPTRSIILIDNRQWLHARNHVQDSERHLRRVRWDAAPFGGDAIDLQI